MVLSTPLQNLLMQFLLVPPASHIPTLHSCKMPGWIFPQNHQHYWKAAVNFPLNHLSSRLNKPCFLSLSSQGKCSCLWPALWRGWSVGRPTWTLDVCCRCDHMSIVLKGEIISSIYWLFGSTGICWHFLELFWYSLSSSGQEIRIETQIAKVSGIICKPLLKDSQRIDCYLLVLMHHVVSVCCLLNPS